RPGPGFKRLAGLVRVDQRPGRLVLARLELLLAPRDQPQVHQPRELVGLPSQLPVPAQLRLDEPERLARPRVVALAAFGAAREMPGLLAYPPRGLRVLHRQLDIFAQRPDKRRVGLIVVPAVRIALPVAAVEVE